MTKLGSPVITVKAASCRTEIASCVSVAFLGVSSLALGYFTFAAFDLVLLITMTVFLRGRILRARRERQNMQADLRTDGHDVH